MQYYKIVGVNGTLLNYANIGQRNIGAELRSLRTLTTLKTLRTTVRTTNSGEFIMRILQIFFAVIRNYSTFVRSFRESKDARRVG